MKIVWEEGQKPDESDQNAEALNPGVKNESDLTRKERRELEKEKLKGMGFRKKLEYIWEYYKPQMAMVVLVIIAFFIGYDIYENSKMVTHLNINVVNGGNYDYEAAEQEVKDILGVNGKYDEVMVGGSLITDATGSEFDYNAQMVFVTQLQAAGLDVVIMPEKLCENQAERGLLADMEEVLGEELYNSFGDRISQYYITLEDSELAEKYDLVYDPVCIGVAVTSKHYENAAKWIETLRN